MSRTRFAIAAALAALLAGCGGGDMSDLRQYVEEVKSRRSSDIKPIPEIKSYEPYTYRPAGRREPFAPAPRSREEEEQRAATGISPDRDRPREPLEQFPLDSLDMKGTLVSGGTVYALIRDPEGVVHRVKRGEHMGQNYGEVVDITPSEVKLIEIVPDGMGGYMKRAAEIALE
ncbi:Tfp pilus assembly protein PilP [Salinisphaera sp. PC39]|uniref:pilus assembly protein PilP n=1 Tax=Salinisphaera sp. PC39 TaxID=1304156 RepID=UPI003341DCB9